jgi:hypothetical protein
MRPIRIDRLSAEQHAEPDCANRTAQDGRLRIRALIVLLAGERLADVLAERTDIRASRTSAYQLLNAAGIHLNRPQHTIASPDPEYARRQHARSSSVLRSPRVLRRGAPLLHARLVGAVSSGGNHGPCRRPTC